jgi:NADH-quinone oxidoreductase subunit C
VARLSDTTDAPALPGDGLREGIIDDLRRRIGDAVVDTHIDPNDDVWIRVRTDAWRDAAGALQAAGFTYFDFLSALDWMPSPYGKGEDDPTAEPEEPDTEIRQGITGGETRFQMLARLVDLDRHVGVTLKADVPDDHLVVDSWSTVFAGANWHERECHEMFGIGFNGHPDLRNMYLPTDFEGYPLRKDFPLLARMIKPWPGIVDVEPMPAEDDTAAGDTAGEASASVDTAGEGSASDEPDAARGGSEADDEPASEGGES